MDEIHTYLNHRTKKMGYVSYFNSNKLKLFGENSFIFNTFTIQEIKTTTPLELIFLKHDEMYDIYVNLAADNPNIYIPGLRKSVFDEMLKKSLTIKDFFNLINI